MENKLMANFTSSSYGLGEKWIAVNGCLITDRTYKFESFVCVFVCFFVMYDALSISFLRAKGICAFASRLLSKWATTRGALKGSFVSILSSRRQWPMILPGQSNRESLPMYKVTFLSVSVQIQRLLRGGIERVALLWLTDWLCDTLLTFLRAISVPFQHTSNTDLMCTLLRRANMGGEYCFFLPIKPQRIKEHSPPSQPIPTSPLTPCYPQSGECGETWRSVQESGAEYRSAAQGELMPRLFSIRNWPLAQKTLLCDQHRPLPPPLLTGICHDIIFWLRRLQSY